MPKVHAAENNTIQVALVGCGGRGTGAAGNALSTKSGPIKLVAMADVFQDRLDGSYESSQADSCRRDKVDVPDDRKFIGFDGYKKAMDCLKPGDVVILATPPAFRWVHFSYAIEKGLNVFMEKPITVDGPSDAQDARAGRRVGEEEPEGRRRPDVPALRGPRRAVRPDQGRRDRRHRAAAGLSPGRPDRLTRSRCPKPADISELLYQIQEFHGFLWASGGCFSDFLIHNIDECCWMKDAWPVKAKGFGGRHYRGNYIDQNFDTYSVEYTFADGAKLFLEGRNIDGCHQEFASYAHGTKGSAVISTAGHSPATLPDLQGPEVRQATTWSGRSASPSRTPTSSNGTT